MKRLQGLACSARDPKPRCEDAQESFKAALI
jgi:hypothetical protein